MVGRRLSHYEITGEISRGGMGVVYRAVDLNLGREVALKVLPEALVHDPARRARLVQEARAASALEHPHIAVIHDVGDADGVTFIAMELIRGEKLSETLARGPLAQSRALELAIEITEGLARAHEKGIVHRDLKPANVMVTEEGHAKIIDFGLAKLVEPVSEDAATAIHGLQTDPGVILGTAAYMAPEQARGGRVDQRSDVFAMGLTLYEMLTARPAFHGPSKLDTLQAVLTQPVPPLSATGAAPADTTSELQRIIVKCTSKDPDDRYQGMKDLIVDLRGARRRLDSASLSAPATAGVQRSPRPAATSRVLPIALAAGVGLLVIAAVAWWIGRTAAPAVTSSGKPALAVLYFENNTGDAGLDWMRTGLTNMLVTDLSQATDFEVVGTDRLLQILQELKRADDPVISSSVVQEIANRAAADTVLVGSYVRAGGTIRINARLQEARTGRIVTAERVEGAGESSLFSLVDELTRRLKSHMTAMVTAPAPLIKTPGAADDRGLDRNLTEVTTSSVEAYRAYVEGLNFHERSLTAQAVAPLERAIAIDPNFAMAYAKLAVVENNLVHIEKRDEYAKRALALVDRLTLGERYYIEGFYYTLRPETLSRGIEAYRQGLALHPEHVASRHNLGLKYSQLERYTEAIEQYEELIRRGTRIPSAYANLAQAYASSGDPGRALALTEEFARAHPEMGAAQHNFGVALAANRRFADARRVFDQAVSLIPRSFQPRIGVAAVAVVENRWADAVEVTRGLRASPDPFQQQLGLVLGAELALARGQSREALSMYERAAAIASNSAEDRAGNHRRMSVLLRRLGKPADALAQAQLAFTDGRNNEEEFETTQELAIAFATSGRAADADKMLAQLESRATILPSAREMRRVHFTRGEIALLRGDTATAVAQLTKAQEMLPPNRSIIGPPSSHPEIWLETARANLKGGRDADAARSLEALQSRPELIFDLDAHVRSFYLLGQVRERQGKTDEARAQYAHFLELRGDGDVDRGWIADAQARIKALTARH